MTRGRRLSVAALAFAFVAVAAWLHLEAGFSLPRPWPDEAHFIAPARQLARHATLDVPALNAPNGIFWVPHGYYVLLAPLLRLPVDALDASRWLSFACVVAFAASVATVARRRGTPIGLAVALPGAWLLLPRVVVAGDIARMEAPVLALAGAGLVLAERDRWPAAAAVGVLAALVHPIGVVVGAVLAAGALLARRAWHVTRLDVVILVTTVLALAAQAVYVAAHWDLAVSHLRFQIQRKAERQVYADTLRLAVASLSAVTAVMVRRVTFAFVAAALAGAFVVVDVLGNEQWYWVLGAETAVLLAVLAVAAAVPRVPAPLTAATGALSVGVAVVGVAWTLTTPVIGMRADYADRGEWFSFVDAAIADLRAYDAQPRPPEAVLVDPISGFTPALEEVAWRRLRFIQATPVTPVDLAHVDLYLTTAGAPFVNARLLQAWGAGPPVIRTRSRGDAYELLVVPRACVKTSSCPDATSSS